MFCQTNHMQAAERAENTVFVPSDLDLQTRPSEGPNTFRVNLAQICSASPEIFHTQTKNHRLAAPKTESSAVHCVQ